MATIKTKFYSSNAEVYVISAERTVYYDREQAACYDKNDEDLKEYIAEGAEFFAVSLSDEEIDDIIYEMDCHEWFAEQKKKYVIAMYLEQHQPVYVCDIASYRDGGSVDLNDHLMFDTFESAEAVKKEIEKFVVDDEHLEFDGWGFGIEEVEF